MSNRSNKARGSDSGERLLLGGKAAWMECTYQGTRHQDVKERACEGCWLVSCIVFVHWAHTNASIAAVTVSGHDQNLQPPKMLQRKVLLQLEYCLLLEPSFN